MSVSVKRLKHVALVNGGQSPPSEEVSDFDGDGLPFLQGNAEFGLEHPTPRNRCDTAPRVACAGSILMSVRAPVGALNLADRDYGIGRGLCAIEPAAGAQRFVWWALQAAVPALRSEATGSTFEAVAVEDVAGVRLPAHDEPMQRRIADFLDDETARIDALIAAKQQMIHRLGERLSVYQNMWLEDLASRFGEIPLKRLAELITVGIVVQPARWYAPSGIPALRGVNVQPGQLDLADLVYLTPEGHAAHPKSALREGDVLVVRTGKAGAAAVVPPALVGANCIDLLLVRTGDAYDSDLLAAVINSERTVARIREQAVGTIQAHFNVGALAQLLVPNAPAADQRVAHDHIAALERDAAALTSVLTRQIEVLRERRQALITAAVTGELAV